NGWVLPLVLTPLALWRGWAATRADPSERTSLWLLVVAWGGTGILFVLWWVATSGGALFSWTLLSPAPALLLPLLGGTTWLLFRLRRNSLEAFRALAPLAAMGLVGPLMFYLLWPYLWHHPIERAAWYFDFHATTSITPGFTSVGCFGSRRFL